MSKTDAVTLSTGIPDADKILFIGEKDDKHLCAKFVTPKGTFPGMYAFEQPEDLMLHMLKHNITAHATKVTMSEAQRILRGKRGMDWLALHRADGSITLIRVRDLTEFLVAPP